MRWQVPGALGWVPGRARRFWTTAWWMARRKPLGAVGAVVILALVVIAIFDSEIARFPALKTNLSERLQSPNGTYLFGTDDLGRDQFSRLVLSTRGALFVAISSVVVGVFAGALVGLASAFWGGPTDLVTQRFMDGLMAMPALIMALALVAALGPGNVNVSIAIAVINIPIANRLVRATVLSIKEEVYVEAARALGASDWRIMARHITPNMGAPVLVLMTNQFASALVVAAALSFLGIGTPVPAPSWGGLLSVGVSRFATLAPWMAISAIIVIFVTILSFIMIGDAIRDLLDPRLRSGATGPREQR